MLTLKCDRIGALATCFAALLAAGIVGCGEKKNGTKETNDPPKTADTTAAPTNTEPARESGWTETPPPDQTAKTTETTQPVETEQPPAVVKVDEPVDQPAQPQPELSKEEQKQAIMDAVYANIRLQMEQAITERKQLLDAGTAPSDEKIRALEGKIMKARDLLVENGETVEEVDPPIVQTQP